jgi:DNA-binding protein HU-beta
MSKTALVDHIAATHAMPRTHADAVVDEVFRFIGQQLKEKAEFRLTGFGTWVTRDTAAREAHNPRTGEKVAVPAGTRVAFRTSAPLKELVQKPKVAAKRKKAA